MSYAPGARVSIRDEEWLIRQIDRTSSEAAVLSVVGLSPLVEGKEASLIDSIERENGETAIVDPRKTKAVADPSSFFCESRLLLESHIRASTPETRSLHLGHLGTMDVLGHHSSGGGAGINALGLVVGEDALEGTHELP
jgi:hypothetical protein